MAYDELTFHPENFSPGDTTFNIEGIEEHVQAIAEDFPKDNFQTPAEQAEQQQLEEQFNPEGTAEFPVGQEPATGLNPEDFGVDEETTSPFEEGRSPFEEGKAEFPTQQPQPQRFTESQRRKFKTDLAYLPLEGEVWDAHEKAGGDANLESTLKTFTTIRDNPALLARYDRNDDGEYTFADWFNVNLTAEQDEAMTEKWLEGLENKNLHYRLLGYNMQTQSEGILGALPGQPWDFLRIGTNEQNMARFTHTRRKHALSGQWDLGEELKQNTVAGGFEFMKQLVSTPEKVGAALQGKNFFTHDAKADDWLFRTNDPMSASSIYADPIQRGWQGTVAYELGYWALPTVITQGAAAKLAGGMKAAAIGTKFLPHSARLAMLRGSRFIAPTLSRGGYVAKGLSVGRQLPKSWLAQGGNVLRTGYSAAALEVIPTGMFRDITEDAMSQGVVEPLFVEKLVSWYPETAMFGRQLAWAMETPAFKQVAYTLDEVALDGSFGIGLASVFKGLIHGLPTVFRLKGVNKLQASTSTRPHSADNPLTPELEWKRNNQRLLDKEEVADVQLNMFDEGPANPYTPKDATDAQLLTGYGPEKNGATMPGQGANPIRNSILEVVNDLDEMSGQVVTDGGSTGPILRPLEVRKFADQGIPNNVRRSLVKALVEDPAYKRQIEALPKAKRTLSNLNDSVYARIQEIDSRDAARLDPKEYWGDLIEDTPMSTGKFGDLDNIQTWSIENLHVADAINHSLLLRLRDMANAAGEITDKTDIFAVGGSMKRIADNLVLGLSEVKRTRYTWSLMREALEETDGKLTDDMLTGINQDITVRADQLLTETQDGVRMMMKMLENSDSRELAEGVLEVFKVSNKIHNWKDFDAWMRQKITGGEFDGKVKTGAMMSELQTVMVNSILSGPKTPLRAILGTTTNAYYNAFNEAAGALVRSPFSNDIVGRKAALAKARGMIELVPEAFNVFRTQLKTKFAGDFANIRTRYSEAPTRNDLNWDLFKEWTERNGTDGDKAALYITEQARNLNNNKILGWSPRVMAATDDTFKWLLARVRAKEKAVREVTDRFGVDELRKLTKEEMGAVEDSFYRTMLDGDGNINLSKDAWLRKQFEEITLTSELKGFSQKLDELMNAFPLTKPFYLFARTGINGLNLSFKNTPLLGLLHKEAIDILTHRGGDFTSLMKYGIENANDLDNARNLLTGRQAVGAAVVGTVATKYMSGQLTGNGPADRQLKQQWINAGWKPNHIYFGDVGFNYASVEPFNVIFSAIADIGDNLELMGSEWAEKRLQAVAFVLGRGLTGKTYMAGLDQMMQMVQMKPWAWNKAAANVLNNSVPLAGLRNEFGKFVNPHMKELNSSAWDSIRNRNQATELLAAKPLPEKSDLLNGKPINNWNFIGRAFNAISPIQVDYRNSSPGRTLLLNSNYDLKSTTYSYNGYSFVENNHVRAHFQNEIGKVPIMVGHRKFDNVEKALDYTSTLPVVKNSMAEMQANVNNPSKWDVNPNNYPHNTLIDNIFSQARAKAWARINDPNHPGYAELEKVKTLKDGRDSKTRDTRSEILDLSFPQREIKRK